MDSLHRNLFILCNLMRICLDGSATTVTQTEAEENVLHIGAFYPLSGSFSSWGQGCLPAATLAQEHINNSTDILKDFKINLVNVDTQGSPGVTTRELFKMLHTGPMKVAILGPYLSHTSIAVAQTARWWHLLQVAPTPFTPSLSDRSLYPYVFRIRAALTTFNPARVALLEAFKWKRVAILTRQTDYFLQTTDLLYRDLTAANISVVTSEVYQTEGEPYEELLRIKKFNVRIVFVFAYDEYARKIFCQIYKMGMYGPQYVWILHYSNDPQWMDKATDDGLCSAEQLRLASNGHLVTRDITLREDHTQPLAKITPQAFIEEYKVKAEEMAITPSEFYAPIVYDALWTIALALNKSLKHGRIRDIARNSSSHFDLGEEVISALMESIEKLTYEGMTGTVRFTKNGEIATLKTKIMQYTDGNYTVHGFHDALQDNLTIVVPVQWKGGRIPFDDVQIVRKRQYVGDVSFYLLISLSAIGVVFASGFFYYNIRHRNEKAIRMSSPNLNNLITLGATLAYCSVITGCCSVRPLSDSWILVTVHMRYATLLIGYSLGFGALFIKTWRVFKIFTTKTAKKVVISDSRLLGFVSIFVLIDMVFMTLWFLINPLYLIDRPGVAMPSADDADLIYMPWIRMATSDNVNIWHTVVYVYKGLILVFGVFLAYQTRKVTIPALNDSKYIGIAIYNVVTICLLAMLTTMLLDSQAVTLTWTITGLSIIAASTATMCTVFLPKIVEMTAIVAPTTGGTGMGTVQSGSRMTGPQQMKPRDEQLPAGSHVDFLSPKPVCLICSRNLNTDRITAVSTAEALSAQ